MVCFFNLCFIFVLRFIFCGHHLLFNIVCLANLSAVALLRPIWNKLYQDLYHVFCCQGLLARFRSGGKPNPCVNHTLFVCQACLGCSRDRYKPNMVQVVCTVHPVRGSSLMRTCIRREGFQAKNILYDEEGSAP